MNDSLAMLHTQPITVAEVTPYPEVPAAGTLRMLPLLPLAQTVLFPHSATTCLVCIPEGRAALTQALIEQTTVVTVAEDTAGQGITPGTIGVEAQVARVMRLPNGTENVLLVGLWRVRIEAVSHHADGLIGHVVYAEPPTVEPLTSQPQRVALLNMLTTVAALSSTLSARVLAEARLTDDAGALADLVANELPLTVAKRQQVLQTVLIAARLQLVHELLAAELAVLQREQGVRSGTDHAERGRVMPSSTRSSTTPTRTALPPDDSGELRTLIDRANLPPVPHTRALEELERLELLVPGAPDYTVARTYLQWLASLPWHLPTTEADIDLHAAAQVLDQHHYGLRKAKNRVLEQLAVRKLAGAEQGSASLCFVGPPGVGKTSLGRAIAAALGRPFVRVALGGIHDEAELRGDRRAYVNAQPGRIIKALRDAGVANPVLMLDEIDKIDGERGDPAAALHELLDPDQNRAWLDQYLDVPFDLGHVLFVCTANNLEEIDDALLDRLDVIPLGGYAEDEKVAIAQHFLLPRQIKVNGLTTTPIRVPDATIRQLTRTYTFEAGVRGLERELAALCRKVARRIAEGKPYPRRIEPQMLPQLLGPSRFEYGTQAERDEVGLATGMVWTEHGGDVLQVEIGVVDGKGNLTLTGQLGDVMQESAQTALSWTRGNAKRLGIDPRRFEKLDIHVHLPEGSVPKDGPSAGITVACALVSALTGRAIRRTVAMTGEITLRGRVLPVGGIREKVLGAYRAGITHVIIPTRNEPELLDDLPPSTQRAMQITYVREMDAVLALAFVDNPLDHPWQLRKRKPKHEAKPPTE